MSAGSRSRTRRFLLAFALFDSVGTLAFAPWTFAESVALGTVTVALLVAACVTVAVMLRSEIKSSTRYRRAADASRTAREAVLAHRKSLAVDDVLYELLGTPRLDPTVDDLSLVASALDAARAKLDGLAGLTTGDAWNTQRRAQVAANAEEIDSVLAEIRSLHEWRELLTPLVYSGRFGELSAPLMLPTVEQIVSDPYLDELARLPRHEVVRRFAAGRPGREWLAILRDFDSMGSDFAPIALALTIPRQRRRLIERLRDSLRDFDWSTAESDRWLIGLAERISALPVAAGRRFTRNLARYLALTQTAIVRTSGREAQAPRPLALVRLRGSVEPNGPNRTPSGATTFTGVAPLKACA